MGTLNDFITIIEYSGFLTIKIYKIINHEKSFTKEEILQIRTEVKTRTTGSTKISGFTISTSHHSFTVMNDKIKEGWCGLVDCNIQEYKIHSQYNMVISKICKFCKNIDDVQSYQYNSE